jgi:hypothetical protein
MADMVVAEIPGFEIATIEALFQPEPRLSLRAE